MGWFNYYGLIAVAILMIPNILSAVLDKGAFINKFNNISKGPRQGKNALALCNANRIFYVQRRYGAVCSAYGLLCNFRDRPYNRQLQKY